MMRVGGVCLLLGSLAPAAALAHAALRSATPPAGAKMAAAPAAIALVFSEALEPAFSSIVVTDVAGARVDRGNLQAVPGDGRTLSESLAPLKPGNYRVTWRAVSVDTHKSQGHYTFTIAQ
jgi:methionine-rich copper-binding protein CopC